MPTGSRTTDDSKYSVVLRAGHDLPDSAVIELETGATSDPHDWDEDEGQASVYFQAEIQRPFVVGSTPAQGAANTIAPFARTRRVSNYGDGFGALTSNDSRLTFGAPVNLVLGDGCMSPERTQTGGCVQSRLTIAPSFEWFGSTDRSRARRIPRLKLTYVRPLSSIAGIKLELDGQRRFYESRLGTDERLRRDWRLTATASLDLGPGLRSVIPKAVDDVEVLVGLRVARVWSNDREAEFRRILLRPSLSLIWAF